jgi:hypothetical protein
MPLNNSINWSVTQYDTLVGGASNIVANVSPGTAAQILTSAGVSTNPSYQNYPSYTPSIVIQTFTGTGTYTPTTGMRYCKIEVFGGGGSGGGSATTDANTLAISSGGGAGGYARGFFYATSIGTSQAVTIGAAGAAPSAGNNNGNAGGTTSVGALISATGGGGGVNSGIVSAITIQSGIAGGTGTGGDVQVSGSASGFTLGATPTNLQLGNGILRTGSGGFLGFGSGALGGALFTASAAITSVAAGNYGGGGSGCASIGVGGGTNAGGAGAAGFVVITEWVFA